MIRFAKIGAMCCMAALTAIASAQTMQYTNYLGAIKVPTGILPIAGDSNGNLFYGTFLASKTSLKVIKNPESYINSTEEAGTTISLFPSFLTGRGLQSLQVSSSGSIFAAGDPQNNGWENVWRFDPSGDTWVENTSFKTTLLAGSSARHSSVAIVSNAGAGLIATNSFYDIEYFDFSGNKVGGTINNGNRNYMREAVFNSANNILYPLRNSGTQAMLVYYVTGVNPITGGGTLVDSNQILTGASNGNSGSSKQNGSYNPLTNQLITCDGERTISNQKVLPTVRVWDLADNGTSVSLAYELTGISPTVPFWSIEDAAVINDKLYVDSSTSGSIFVFGPAPASVNKWDAYGDR